MFTPQLDHIIIKIPHAKLLEPPPALTDFFTLSSISRHADNKTENRLVILRDGVYLEFIAFIDDSPALKDGHWWGALPNGIIDFALTSPDVSDVEAVRSTLKELKDAEGEDAKGEQTGVGITYAEPRAGGRSTGGRDIKWNVTFPMSTTPSETLRRGGAPFWCHDVTPRESRVPCNDADATTHPFAAIGLKSISVGVPDAKFKQYERLYAAIAGPAQKNHGRPTFSVRSPVGERPVQIVMMPGLPAESEEPRILGFSLWTVKGERGNTKNMEFGDGSGYSFDIAFINVHKK